MPMLYCFNNNHTESDIQAKCFYDNIYFKIFYTIKIIIYKLKVGRLKKV